MNLSVQEITAELFDLPEQEQQEVADFIAFLKTKLAQQKLKRFVSRNEPLSPIYKAFEQSGLIGCIETDEQFSTTYKEKLDFSFKHGEAR